MAKHKRKIAASQRDKTAITIAKELKKSGILSKQANLHSGKYISRFVLKKVRQYENIANLDYGAVKVSRDIAKAAKERGFEVVQGNKIIGPKTPQFRNRLRKGEITGVKPVRGGYMEEVILPHTTYDLRSLVQELGEGIDNLKLPNEQFAFKYQGNESSRGFSNSKQLLEYLLHYKGIETALSERPEDLQEQFDAISIFRLHPNDTTRVIPGATERRKRSDAKRRQHTRQKKQRERLSDLQLHRLRERERIKKEKQRERIKKDPFKREEYLTKAKNRMAKHRGKGK